MTIPERLYALAPTELGIYRQQRYDGGGFGVRLNQFAPEDVSLIIQLYHAVKRIYDLWLYMRDAPNYDLLGQQIITQFGSDQFLTSVQAIGSATYAATPPSPLLRKVVHDIRSGGLTTLTGTVYLLREAAPAHFQEDVQTAVLVARDHAKLMRNAIIDLDPTVRQADESLKVHFIDDFVKKWHGAAFKVAEKSIRVQVACTFEGSVTNRCLETSAIDRILYNYINNAARFSADGRVDLTIFPISDSLVRWVVVNPITSQQQAWLAGATGSDLKKLFTGGLTRGGHGLGLANCTDFVAASFGLAPEQALEQGYLGAHLIDRDYHAWFHWPAYHPSPQQAEAACDCN
jgi:hypothetical protein